METIKLLDNYNIKINIFISDFNEWEFVEDSETSIQDLFNQVNEYLIAYNRLHYKLHHIELNIDNCNIYLIEY